MSADSKGTAQILFAGAQEILGMEGLRRVMERLQTEDLLVAQAGPFLRELQVLYGEPGGRGLALRIGRAVFRYVLKYQGDQAGFRAAEFRLMPAPRRLENGLRILARLIGEECDSDIAVSDEGAHWSWRMDRRATRGNAHGCAQDNAPVSASAGLQEGDPCYLIAGMLQEFTAWAGGGRFYRVIETDCQAAGCPACVYRIEKKPLD